MFHSSTDTTDVKWLLGPKIRMYPISNVDYTHSVAWPLPWCAVMAKEKKESKKHTHAQSRLRHRRTEMKNEVSPNRYRYGLAICTWILGWCEMNLFCFLFLSGFKKRFTGGHARHAKVDFDIVCDVYLWWSQPLVTQNCTSPKSPVAFAQSNNIEEKNKNRKHRRSKKKTE